MNDFGLTFHHLGLAVRTPQAAAAFLGGLGYSLGPSVYDPRQNVLLQMAESPGGPTVEIISPGEGPGPIDRLITRHSDGLIYHVCYVTEDLNATLTTIKAAGLRAICVSEPTPAVLFGGRPVSFYTVQGLGLIEVIEGLIE
jgi:methylmalonyl-CoA/ethylmalonyl-CoA epimerase